MANHPPGTLYQNPSCGTVQYALTVPQFASPDGVRVYHANAYQLVSLNFPYTADQDGVRTYDMSSWDQDVFEVALKGNMTALATGIAAMMQGAYTLAQVQAQITITRTWWFYMGGADLPQITETVSYP